MPPGGGFTGNRSVDWFVSVDYARPKKTTVNSRGNTGVRHRGVEDTRGGGYRFKITINHPQDASERAKFLQQLAAAGANTNAAQTILDIPVEDQDSGYKPPKEYQITVDWVGPTGVKLQPAKPYPKRRKIKLRF